MANSGGIENKMKEEVYSQLGGMNNKVGLYSNGPMEFQNIVNFDFQTPGALTQRWGSTLYQSQNFSGPITSLFEYVKIDGSSYMMVGTSGALWSGATTGQAQGLSLSNFGSTFVSIAYFRDLHPQANGLVSQNPFFLSYNSDPHIVINSLFDASSSAAGTTLYINPANLSANRMSYAELQNHLFLADGNVFAKFDGATTSFVGLPPVTQGYGSTINWGSNATFIGLAIQDTYGIGFYASYVNRRGFEGPVWPIDTVTMSGFNGTTAVALGGTIAQIKVPLFVPPEYDIASINLYSYAGTSLSLLNAAGSSNFWNLPYVFLSNTAVTAGNTFTFVTLGTGQGRGQSNIIGNIGAFPANPNYVPFGMTFVLGTGTTQGIVTQIDMINYAPRYLEVYQNRLFLAGFSATPSTVWFSDVGEPEGYDPEWNFEVRTNDGDRITSIINYNSRLYIFKQFSFSELSGDNPDNFFERQVSSIYGCLSSHAVVVYNDIMLFLDAKGVMRFNGASLDCISNKIQPIFDSMNITAAIDNATMVHDKSRNQILLGIPVNGSSVNNLTVVYDYISDAWTKYEGYNPAVYATAKQRFTVKTALFGGYSGQVMNFGASLPSDNGIGFTTLFKTGFHADAGQTNEKLWRRLWTNVDEATGATVPCNINFYANYGASVVLNRTTYLSPFQSRLDFGISSKSIAFEFSKFSATTMIRYYGHGFAYRYQRGV